MIYIASVRPFNSRATNRREILNEVAILITNQLLLVFSDFCENDEFKYYVGGWFYISVVVACIAMNLFFVLAHVLRRLRLIYIRYMNRFKHSKRKMQATSTSSSSESLSSSEESSETVEQEVFYTLRKPREEKTLRNIFDADAWNLKI